MQSEIERLNIILGVLTMKAKSDQKEIDQLFVKTKRLQNKLDKDEKTLKQRELFLNTCDGFIKDFKSINEQLSKYLE